jgi:hypothetical protein
LKPCQISLFDRPDKSVDKVFTAQELDYRVVKSSLGFKTDCMQKMRFPQSGTAVDKKWIVGIPGRLAYRYTTRLSKAVARPDYKIVKSIIRMESQAGLVPLLAPIKSFDGVDVEINRDEMAGYLLSRAGETALAIVPQKLNRSSIGTAYSERAAIQMQNRQLLEPLACVGRVKCFCTLKYISKDVFNFGGCHTTVPCESMFDAKSNYPPEHPC